MIGGDRRLTRIHQQEGPGAVGVFRRSRLKTTLTERGCLLIANQRRHGDGPAEQGRVGLAVNAAGGPHLGQHGPGHVKQSEQFIVPLAAVDVEHQRAAGIAGVGGVNSPAG